ncbi:GNAT family N-acetyltransferase [Microbulbifer sediminum]|uniref:GNAT family N-acetyltransferase n=1 Tax=Microbulbifer sediminum TaxID=2904250 RepID=UPI001EFF90D2|nr:GNAT family N-acetyltransferase [Microbulbifer sediminum]
MIRPLVPADRERLERLWIDTFSEAHPSLPRRFWEARRPVFYRALAAETVRVFSRCGLVRPDGLVSVSSDGELQCLFVARALQGTGAGSLLLDHVVEENRVRSVRVLEENLGGRFFLQRYGFIETGREANPVAGQQELVMYREELRTESMRRRA